MQEVERTHCSFTSSRNAVAAFSWSIGRCVSIAGSGLGGEGEKSGLFFPHTLLKPAVCSKAKEAFPGLNCQSNAKCTGALLIISLLRGFTLEFCFKLLLIQPVTCFGEKRPVFFWQRDDCSIFHDFSSKEIPGSALQEKTFLNIIAKPVRFPQGY